MLAISVFVESWQDVAGAHGVLSYGFSTYNYNPIEHYFIDVINASSVLSTADTLHKCCTALEYAPLPPIIMNTIRDVLLKVVTFNMFIGTFSTNFSVHYRTYIMLSQSAYEATMYHHDAKILEEEIERAGAVPELQPFVSFLF
ncbi:MAG: hypothetical protein L7H04_07290 [Vulcanisaeta sp.]|nr:hypothetical protein [Vulcanisaeta sp.]